MKTKIKKLALKIERHDEQKEKMDAEYNKLLWNEIKKFTHRLEDLPKAIAILNSHYQTVSTFELFNKLRIIKQKLKDGK